MNDSVHQHLTMIQGVISRMSTNAFLVKSWVVTLVAAMIVLGTKDSNPAFILIAYIPIPIFWALDAYYLTLERSFRKLYDKVRIQDKSDYSMDLSKLNLSRLSYCSALKSKTVAPLYLVLLISVFLVSKLLTG